ncbi:molybdopterin-guanine dinucleotide biosynthesis protein A [Desulfosporosinus meridiei DSM 13257]|uniref:Probable molybdenum cofactor guanylyltransferase n=1 Tax=Desulfosporosinus meridiei (strain ATCC BAA-275 / DSM 13257 / KCTC 12902 / NCIMB 13706 / S10) TaxID=768704 RepID=J7ILT0_DESMD|nr:molybdopterin-guanine dinucleotide biosynthesis protein A [Desulfosporosinus meridiei DSM 13257]
MQATGVLLAGGKSSRMKKDKAFLEIEGQSLAERSLKVLKALFPEVLISSNQPELFAQYELPVIRDEVIGRGPLEGLYQGLKAAKHDVVFFVACDMPFLEIELIRFLAKWSSDYDLVVPKLQSGLHPLHAFYHRRCLSAIKNNLEAGRLKIIDFYSACSAKYVDEKEMSGCFTDLTNAFCNVNTPEEWSYINKTITPI